MIHTPLQVMESHQATKLDVSGTAKAVISCFQKLGVSFDMDEVLQRTFAVNE
jgi:4-hydroxy-tetrahydrodipicolinate reductase